MYIHKWPWAPPEGGTEYPWWKYMNRPAPAIGEADDILRRGTSIQNVVFFVEPGRTSFDTTIMETSTLYNCKGLILQIDNKPLSGFLEEAEALEHLFSHVNEACIWKPDFNEGCSPLETNPQKIITGRWRLTKSLNRSYKGITIFYSVPYLWWLEFNSNGSIIQEYYNSNNEFIKDEGTFTIDSLLRFTNIGERNLIYEFLYCNNSMKLTTTMGFDEQQFIYERQ